MTVSNKPFRVALVAHLPSGGGISRFLLALGKHLLEVDPDLELGLFIDEQVAVRDNLAEEFDGPRSKITSFENPSVGESTPLADRLAPRRGPIWRTGKWLATRNDWLYGRSLGMLHALREMLGGGAVWYRAPFPKQLLKQINEYDLVYFVNPFFMEPVDIKPPIVATVHDLNFKHFKKNYTPDMLDIVNRQTEHWMKRIDVVVDSTKFIRDEVEHFYPITKGKTRIIYLAPYSYSAPEMDAARATVHGMGLPDRFVVYPTNSGEHKNISGLIRAAEVMKSRGETVPVIITGVRTNLIAGEEAFHDRDPLQEPQKVLRQSDLIVGKDVFFLGYVSNVEVDALTKAAAVVVSPSVYEAGCGPALDAWQFGVPVAFSNIPPYLEQMEVLGTRAWVFDPKDPEDIASTILRAMAETQRTAEMVALSQTHIHDYRWEEVASQYDAVFREAAGRPPLPASSS